MNKMVKDRVDNLLLKNSVEIKVEGRHGPKVR